MRNLIKQALKSRARLSKKSRVSRWNIVKNVHVRCCINNFNIFIKISYEKAFCELKSKFLFFFFFFTMWSMNEKRGFACRVLLEHPIHIRRKDNPFGTATPTFTLCSFKYRRRDLTLESPLTLAHVSIDTSLRIVECDIEDHR